MKLSTKLVILVGGLATAATTFALLAVSIFIYVSTEQQIRVRLASQAKAIATEHIQVETEKLNLINNPEGLTLQMSLREYDASLYIFDQKNKTYAQYGIYKDLDQNQQEMLLSFDFTEQFLSKTKGVYRDFSLPRYGLYDTYTMPIVTADGNRGYLQIASQNTLWPMLQKGMLVSFAFLLPLVWLISLLVAIFSARLILHPLKRLVEYIDSINIDRLPKKIYLIPTLDQEVASLTRAFNLLLKRVALSLTRQKEVAENISHELKTPLTRISSSLDVLIRHSSDENKSKLITIKNEAINLGANVDVILAMAEPSINDRHELINPKLIITQILKSLNPDLTLDVNLADNFLIPADKNVLQVVIRNILENASKYNVKNGYIEINGKLNKSSWTLDFLNSTDSKSSIGEHLFSRWQRGTKIKKGHGLGLAIVNELCEQNEIKIEMNKKGSEEVTVRLTGYFNQTS